MGLTHQCLLRGTLKIPLTGAWGFLLSTPGVAVKAKYP